MILMTPFLFIPEECNSKGNQLGPWGKKPRVKFGLERMKSKDNFKLELIKKQKPFEGLH